MGLLIFVYYHIYANINREPGGVNLAEKVTNFDMVSNDLHIKISNEMNEWMISN